MVTSNTVPKMESLTKSAMAGRVLDGSAVPGGMRGCRCHVMQGKPAARRTASSYRCDGLSLHLQALGLENEWDSLAR